MSGNTVVAIRIPDNSSSTPTMSPATQFSQGRFTHGPNTSGSLHSSSRNTLALGSSSPARACTAVVINPSGAPGMSTIAAASATIAV